MELVSFQHLWREGRDEAVGEVEDADARVCEGAGLEGADGVPREAGVVDVLEVEEGAGRQHRDVVLAQKQGVQAEAALQGRLVSFGHHQNTLFSHDISWHALCFRIIETHLTR